MARRALLMGNASYPADDALTDLLCPINDVDGLAAVLADPALGGFETVIPLRDASSTEAKRALVNFLREAHPRDTVLFYYSGHGKLDGSFALHLCTCESEADIVEATALPISFVQDQFQRCRAENSVLLLDCCYSGAAKGVRARGNVGDTLKLAMEGTGTYLLTASDSIETAQEKEGDRYGVFTKHVIEGLQSGAADREGRGFVTMDDLYDYVVRAVRADSPQRPNRQVGGHGDIVIAKSGKDSRKDRARAAAQLLFGRVAAGDLDPAIATASEAVARLPPGQLSPGDAAIDAALSDLLADRSTLGAFVTAYWRTKSSAEKTDDRMPGQRPETGEGDERHDVFAKRHDPPSESISSDTVAQRGVLSPQAGALRLLLNYGLAFVTLIYSVFYLANWNYVGNAMRVVQGQFDPIQYYIYICLFALAVLAAAAVFRSLVHRIGWILNLISIVVIFSLYFFAFVYY